MSRICTVSQKELNNCQVASRTCQWHHRVVIISCSPVNIGTYKEKISELNTSKSFLKESIDKYSIFWNKDKLFSSNLPNSYTHFWGKSKGFWITDGFYTSSSSSCKDKAVMTVTVGLVSAKREGTLTVYKAQLLNFHSKHLSVSLHGAIFTVSDSTWGCVFPEVFFKKLKIFAVLQIYLLIYTRVGKVTSKIFCDSLYHELNEIQKTLNSLTNAHIHITRLILKKDHKHAEL